MDLTLKFRDVLRLMTYTALTLPCLAAQAAEPFEASALELADLPSEPVTTPKLFNAYAEFAAGRSGLASDAHQKVGRLSTYVQYDAALIPDWRIAFSDRLDVNWPAQTGSEQAINTIEEVYVTRKFGTSALIDIGRIKVRNGVAANYNPTDYFKTGALRSITSLDPATLKDHRQGSVMVQGQILWSSGSLTALYSPMLADRADSGGFNLNFGGTNASERFLVSLNQTVVANVTSQFLLFKETRQAPQVGFNMTALSGKATVLNLEWSGGRSASGYVQALASQGEGAADDSVFRSKFAVSVTHTTAKKISLTAELDYNGAGMRREQWNELSSTSSPSYSVYRNWTSNQQELVTEKSAFFHLIWRNLFFSKLDLTLLRRFNLDDHSHATWAEVTYRASDSQFAIQFERFGGSPASDFGVALKKQNVFFVWRKYL